MSRETFGSNRCAGEARYKRLMHVSTMPVPLGLRTARLLLRPWRPDDATELLPVLEANRAHLGPWIPARVANPAPLPDLAARLAEFAEEMTARLPGILRAEIRCDARNAPSAAIPRRLGFTLERRQEGPTRTNLSRGDVTQVWTHPLSSPLREMEGVATAG